MNLARFQICLNHNDPNIVAKGLEEFQRQALWDLTCSTDSSCKYGYYGVSCISELWKVAPEAAMQNILHPILLEGSDTDGILVKYLAASPEVEELFVIWTLQNRDLHLALSIQHTATFSIIIHCLNCLKSQCDFALQLSVKIANRLISNHSKAILNQISSSSVELVHSTMGLLFSMCKISANMCQAVHLKIISTSLQTFTSAIQSKQTVVHSCINEHAHQTMTLEVKQLMTMILLLTIESCVVEQSDESISILDQILPAPNQSHQAAGFGSSKNSLLKKVLQHTVNTESSLLQRFLMLNGLLYLLQYPALDQYLHILFESAFIQKLLDMNRETLSVDDQSNLVQEFFLALSHQLVQKCSSFKKNGQQSTSYNSVHGCAATVVRHLKAEAVTEHKQIQGVLVEGIPSLLSKCVSALTISSWQPVPTPQYFSCLSHLSWLVSRAGVDAKTKATLRKMTSRGASDRKVAADELLRAVIPSELTKKDMMKLLSHSNHDLKLLGWAYASNVLAWLLRVFAEASVARSGDAESVLIDHGFFKVLPDMAFILSIRSGVLRDVNAQFKDKEKEKAVESAIAADSIDVQEPIKVDTIDEDFDFNFDGAIDENETAPPKAAVVSVSVSPPHLETSGKHESLTIDGKILRTVHKVIEHYMLLIPNTVLQEKFDFLRLLDEHVKWPPQQTLQEAADHWKETADKTLTLSILHILKLCGKSHCRWFGTLEETTKMLTNILVAEDWAKSTKRTVLAKLMLLTHSSATVDGPHPAMTEDVALKARSLLRAIVTDTQLFFGQTVLDLELGIELESWLRIATVGSEWGKYSLTSGPTKESALIVDIILHLAYHWNTALCIEISSIASASTQDIKYLWSVWDKKDFSILSPTIEPSSVEDMLPISPLLFATISLLKLELKVFAAQLPVYVQNYIADKLAPQSQTFFQKYFSRFFKDLEDVLLDIVYTTWKASRSRETYVCVIERLLLSNDEIESTSTKRTTEQIQQWKQLTSNLDPADNSLTSLPYQQIVQLDRVFNSDNLFPVLRKLLNKKARKNGGDVEPLHITSAIVFSVSVLNTTDGQIASTGSILGEFMSSNLDIISILYLRQSEQVITIQGLEWLRGQVGRLGEEVDSAIVRQASFLSYALHISNYCCKSFGRIIFHKADNKTGDVSNASEEFAMAMKSFVDTVYTVVDKLLNSHTTRSSVLFVSVLSSSTSHLFDSVFDSNYFTQFSRQFLYRYAQIQLSSSSSKSKMKGKFEPMTMLWEALIAHFSYDCDCDSSMEEISFGTGNSAVSLDSLLLLVNKLLRNEYLQAHCAKLVLRYHDIGSREESIKLLKREISLSADASVLLYEVDPACQLIVNQFEVKFFPKIVFDKTAKFFDIIPMGGGQVTAPRPGVLLTVTNGSISYYLNPFCLIDMNEEFRERYHPIRQLDIEMNNIQPNIFSSPYLSVFESCSDESKGHNVGVMETIAALASTPLPMMNITNFKLSSNELATCFSEDWSHGDVKLSSLQYQAVVHYLSSLEDKVIVKSARILLYILERQGRKDAVVYFVHNFLSVLIQCPSASNAVMTEYSTMPTLPVIFMLRDLNLEECSPSIAMEMLLDTIAHYLDTLVVFVKKNISSEGGTGDIILYERLLNRVSEFLALEYSRFPEDSSVQLAAARGKLNSAIRYCLKVYFDSSLTHSYIFDMIMLATRKKNTLAYGLLQSAQGLHSDSLLRPVVMLQMITGHSKFADIISTRKTAHDSRVDAATARRNGLWKLVLVTVSSIVEEKSEVGDGESFESSCTILLDTFQQEYRGTLSVADRLMLRTIHLLYSKGIGGAPCSHTVKNVTVSRQAAKTIDSKVEWVIDILSSSMVYSTLAEYSIQKPSYSLPFDFESQTIHSQHRADVKKQLKLLSNVMAPSALKKRRSSDSSSSDEEGYDDALHSDKYPAPQQVDTLEACAEKSYDPSFFLSALLYMLQRGAVVSNSKADGDNTVSEEETESAISMRRMASTGGLALVIAGLSSSCPVNRTYALACLHKVWTILKGQTSERDALFKERPQIQLLLNFIRNATAGLRSKSVFRLPPGTAIFLARCSIQLMQPGGELYSEMNRYLLSRPFCDECDVPLLDFVIFNGDVETFITEKVAALRLVRDGLLTVQDHLNLSRKNAYNRLMMMFPIICYDTRAGHSILDIFDRALRMKISSQYLLEQCDFLHFIGVLLSPTSHAVKRETNSDLSAFFGPTSKYLLRLFQLFRRAISVATVLARQGEMSITTVLHAQSLLLGYQSKLKVLQDNDSLHVLRQLPEEYFRLMTLCMWDVTMSLQGFSEQHHNLRFVDLDVVTSFIAIVEAYETAKMSASHTDTVSDIVVAVVCLLAFKSSYSNGATLSPTALKSDIRLVIKKCYDICMQRLLKRDCLPSSSGTFYAIERFCETHPVRSHKGHSSAAVPTTTLLDLDTFSVEVELSQLLEEEFLVHCCVKLIAQGIAYFGDTDEFDMLALGRLGLVIWSSYFHDASSLFCRRDSIRVSSHRIIVAIEGIRSNEELYLLYATNGLSLARLSYLLAHSISMQGDRMKALTWTIAEPLLTTMAQLTTVLRRQQPSDDHIFRTLDELCLSSKSSVLALGLMTTKSLQLCSMVITVLDAAATNRVVETLTIPNRLQSMITAQSLFLQSMELDEADLPTSTATIWNVAVSENSFFQFTRSQHLDDKEGGTQGQAGLPVADQEGSKKRKRPVVSNSGRNEKKKKLFKPIHLNHHL